MEHECIKGEKLRNYMKYSVYDLSKKKKIAQKIFQANFQRKMHSIKMRCTQNIYETNTHASGPNVLSYMMVAKECVIFALCTNNNNNSQATPNRESQKQ